MHGRAMRVASIAGDCQVIYWIEHGDLRWSFDSAHDTAMFMWGRDFAEYRIYKAGRRFRWTSGDLAQFEVALKAF